MSGPVLHAVGDTSLTRVTGAPLLVTSSAISALAGSSWLPCSAAGTCACCRAPGEGGTPLETCSLLLPANTARAGVVPSLDAYPGGFTSRHSSVTASSAEVTQPDAPRAAADSPADADVAALEVAAAADGAAAPPETPAETASSPDCALRAVGSANLAAGFLGRRPGSAPRLRATKLGG